MTNTDLYINLFGKGHIQDGDVISMSEHGRVGGVSTGEGYKKVGMWEVPPTDPSKTNPSYVISYNAADECVKIEQTIGATTYTMTFTRSDNTVVRTLPISAWS